MSIKLQATPSKEARQFEAACIYRGTGSVAIPIAASAYPLAAVTRNGSFHGEIYKQRPDVQAVVHMHVPSVILFSTSQVPLRPMFHMSAFVGQGAPVFEIRDAAGMTNMLVSKPAIGSALAEPLGNKPAALMRGHGAVGCYGGEKRFRLTISQRKNQGHHRPIRVCAFRRKNSIIKPSIGATRTDDGCDPRNGPCRALMHTFAPE